MSKLISCLLLVCSFCVFYSHANEFTEMSEDADNAKIMRFLPHQSSYILPFSYNSSPNNEVRSQIDPELTTDKMEVKYQISGKLKVIEGGWDVWMGYTQTAWWQLYNTEDSAPFRETNYSPEIYTSFYPGMNILGFDLLSTDIGFIHQSNGQSGLMSRSWNRAYLNFKLARDNYVIEIQPWYRLQEDAEDDDNSDINKYLGYGNFKLSYKGSSIMYSLLLRNNFRVDENKGAVELSMALPLYDMAKIYIQYFNGYGESLLDYNHVSNRLSLGILIFNW